MVKLQDKSLFVICGETCYLITKDHWQEIQALQTAQEETDSRMLLHARHTAEDGFKSIVISTEDTDMLILCIIFSKKLACSLYQKSGTQNRTRYIGLCQLAQSLDDSVSQALVGLHAFTGCDRVSALQVVVSFVQ